MYRKIKTFIFIISLCCGGLLMAVSWPLAQRKIAMNKAYGVRFDESYLSDAHWYATNEYGGWALIWASVAMILANVILFLFRKRVSPMVYTLIFMGIMMVALFTASYFSAAFAENLAL